MRRTILFGDIHGCHREWETLLDKLAVSSSDRLIALGDLVCKGPSTARTLGLAMGLTNLTCLVGNHEQRLLDAWRGGHRGEAKQCERAVKRQLGERYEAFMNYVASWPYYLQFPGLIAVHGGLRPGTPLQKQSPRDLIELRRLSPDGPPWYEQYHGPKLAVFGHWVRRDPLLRKNAVGLDTGCVYGGRLSAYVWPEGRVVSVPARKAYQRKKGNWE